MITQVTRQDINVTNSTSADMTNETTTSGIGGHRRLGSHAMV